MRTLTAALIGLGAIAGTAGITGGASAEDLKIALIYGRTGALEAYAKQTETGLRLGFEYATRSGITIAIGDIKVPERKTEMLADADQEVARIEKDFRRGLITDGFFARTRNPNYLGEILEWTGWAVATWSLPGLMFALYTAANLVPRARANHKWYRETFRDYPPERKAVLPLLY